MKDVAGRVCVITGGVSGIGRALAERCMSGGCRGLVIGDLNPEQLATAKGELGELGDAEVLTVTMDAGKLEDVQRLLDDTLSAFGAVHLACFNAGVGGSPGSMTVLDADLEKWEWVEQVRRAFFFFSTLWAGLQVVNFCPQVNFWGVLYGSKLFGKYMSEQAIESGVESHIINTVSVAGVSGGGLGAYSTSKHSALAVTEKLMEELQANGAFPTMGASALCPAFVNTNINDGVSRLRSARRAWCHAIARSVCVSFCLRAGEIRRGGGEGRGSQDKGPKERRHAGHARE